MAVLATLLAGATLTYWLEYLLLRPGQVSGPASGADLRHNHVANSDRWLLPAAPIVGVALAMLVVPFGSGLIGRDLGIGLFYVIVVIDFVVLGLALAGWGADTPGAMMAGMDMTLIERLFSKGLVPLGRPHGGRMHGDHKGGQDSDNQENDAAEHAGGDRRRDRHSMQHGAHAAPDHPSMQHVDDTGHEGHARHHGDGNHSSTEMGEMDMSMVTPIRPVAAWLAVAVGILLVGMLLLRPAWRVVDALPDPDSARRIGQLLMEKYMVAFEGAGFLILIGIFGAVLLARPSTYPDDSSRSAKVAVDEKPEPIAHDGLSPLTRSERSDEHQPRQQRPKEHGA